jgi:MFS family permease
MATTLVLEGVAASIFALRPGTALLVVAAVIFGSGAFSMPGLMGAACGERFGAKLASASLGFVTVFIGVGQALGPYLGGLLADASSSYSAPYVLSAGVFAVGVLAALLLRCPVGSQSLAMREQSPEESL